MKKTIGILVSCLTVFVLFMGCQDDNNIEKSTKSSTSNNNNDKAADSSCLKTAVLQTDNEKTSESVVNLENAEKVQVKIITTVGDIVVELDRKNAPETVKNFLGYVGDGFYEETIFHRVIDGFMIQTGGLDENLAKKITKGPILNESDNGLQNLRGTVAMARSKNPNSATSQFYINLKDNHFLDYSENKPGYAVFGKVTAGMDIVETIAKVKTVTKCGREDVPITPIKIISVDVQK